MVFGVTWDYRRRRSFAAIAIALVLAAAAPVAADGASDLVRVIVRSEPGASAETTRAVLRSGGTVERHIGIIDGLVATVRRSSLPALVSNPAVRAVTPDAAITLNHTTDGLDANTDAGSMYNSAKTIRAHDAWRSGHTGAGVGVALIDSGVVRVNGLTAPGKVVNGPDLSFESPYADVEHLDTYGHGTHMAGIIAGRDDGVAPAQYDSHDVFVGIAPDARIVNVKVANANGATDVSQVIAAIDWVVAHRNDAAMNIRVLNLSFGTDGVQDYMLDPLAYAAEQAWRSGVVVVVAAGNSGYGTAKLNNPAYDPYVIAVGADDTRGTYTTDDDVIPDWSSRGDGVRNPDLVAPGKSIASLRDPGSNIDTANPAGRVGTRYFRGSGTSQAAAMVSGAAAVLLSQRPGLTPDQVKRLLTTTASSLPAGDPVAQGSGLLNVRAALNAPTPAYTQTWPASTGSGSLEAARGSAHVVADGVELRGEVDIFGATWSGATWSGATWSGATWSGATWSGATWSGATWSGATWSGATWSGVKWNGATWSGATWSGATWSGATWSGATWSGATWSGATWSGAAWSGNEWA